MALRAALCLSIVCSIIRLVNPELDIRPVDCKNINGIIMHKVCYKYESTALSWEKAKQFCLEKQMTLLASDDLMVLQNLQEAVLIVADKDPTESHTYWLGARYKQSAAAYYWYHNKQPLPNPGSFNLPATHDSSRECLVVKRDKITEESCDKTHEFFCQHEGISKFGNNMLCHCALGYCDTDGKCLRPDSLCEKNWFAESCQYYDIAADIESVNSLLRDNDDKTCITMRGLTLTLNKPFYFTWMRLVFKRKGENSGIQIGFRLRTQTEVACTDQVMLTIDDVTVDLICRFEQVLVTVITISWEGERSICSVYISGGQNLAYMGSTSQSGSEVTSHYPIDGVKGYPALCASTDHTLDNQYWLLLFSQPYSIHTVFLYRQTNTRGYRFMDRFVLEFMNENNQVVNTFTDRGQNNNRDMVEVNYPGPTPSLTLRVALTTQRNQAQQHIELCEVEAFGDCVAPYYGLECQKLCSRACLNQVCHTTGQCIKCADGGTTCNENVTPKNILVPPTQVPRRERKHEAESQALVIVFFLLTLSVSIFCFFIYLVMRNRKALICSKGTNVEASESHMQPIIPVTAVSQRPASDISSIYSEAKTESSV